VEDDLGVMQRREWKDVPHQQPANAFSSPVAPDIEPPQPPAGRGLAVNPADTNQRRPGETREERFAVLIKPICTGCPFISQTLEKTKALFLAFLD
jgi:hypothetical protein